MPLTVNYDKITVEHNGNTYIFDPASESEADIEFVRDFSEGDNYNQVIYVYLLKGLHEGAPIEVYMLNADREYDEDGVSYVWDKLLYADDRTKVPAEIEDAYESALREDIKEIFSH